MHIKEVNITGFRSYREVTSIDSFSRKHNVIVGRNGSGKSNFFFAIQFVLSDEFAHLRQEQRMGVLHEGTGPRITSAKVEIVFDNSDRRIPAAESNEVKVVRQIAQKKDQYYIDGKLVARAEVVNLMESAGFSRSNPYYIVKQGKINELATAPDPHRLKLLKEVAGTRVYDERKEESLKILKETSNKTKKVEDLLAFIEDRLKTLESEKEDLKEYQRWDKMKRSIEYTMYDVEIREARKKLDQLAEQREELNSRQHKVNGDLMDVQNRGMKAHAEQRKLESRFKGMKEEKEALLQEQASRFEKRTELELLIKDLKEDVERERSGRDKAEDVLQKLKSDIAEKQEQLDEITPQYEKLVEEEARLHSDIRIAENRLKDLLQKMGHGTTFKTTEERDNFLRREIRFVQSQLRETEDQMGVIERSLVEEANDEQQVNDMIQSLAVQLEETHSAMEKANSNHTRLKKEYERAVHLQHDASRQEKERRDQVEQLKGDLMHADNTLKHLTNKSTNQGVESVRRVVEWFRQNNHNGKHDDVVNGYYGIMMELIECGTEYYQAVEVTAGSRLYFHVVSDDRVTMKIINKINQLNMPGSLDFFPLNRLAAPSRRSTNDPDARAILDIMDYDSKFDAAFRLVFAGTVIVRRLEDGSRLAKNEGFDAVTLEGDQISRRGALTGGYIDRKKSKLELYNQIRLQEEAKEQAQNDLANLTRHAQTRAADAEKIRFEIDKVENDLRELKERHRFLTEKKRYASERLGSSARGTDQKKNQLLMLRNRIRELTDKKENLESDIGQALESQLSDEEQRNVEKLQREIKEKRSSCETVTTEKTKLESVKSRLENQLQTNLLRKRDNLTAKIQDISVDEKRHNLESESTELQSVIARLNEIMHRLNELDESLHEYEETAEKLTRELDDVQEQQKDLEQQVSEFSKQADMICTKQSTLYSKREESVKKIRDLGSLPTEAFSKYQNLSSKQLDKKLAECMNELKKYENVNKKALDQFVQAASQKEELTKRMEEQQKSEASIKELLEVLENRKYEAIHLTFKQVSKNFREVFAKLVPGGCGDLVMQAPGVCESDSSLSQQPDTRHTIEKFTGIGIRVSFASTSETREMQQLSGGQKTLVALALIFAIQKCDPAPFYLFDEIDAALDPMHRKAVADMIHELAENAQFITTTFRPELLASAEKYYGVKFRNKVSHIDTVTKEQAYDFVEDDQTHG